jgi:hypothetical protein
MSGARSELKIGDKVLAYVTDVSISVSVTVRPVHTFGAITARSVEPLQTSPVMVTIGRVIPMNKADGTSVNTSNVAEGIEPTIAAMLRADDIQVTLQDKITGKTIANVMNCRFAGSSKSLSASQLASERIQLMGIYDAGPNNQNSAPKIGL